MKCKCGSAKCRGELSGKKMTQDIAKLHPEQRGLLKLKQFESSLKEKPTQIPSSLTLFINGRLIPEEIKEVGACLSLLPLNSSPHLRGRPLVVVTHGCCL